MNQRLHDLAADAPAPRHWRVLNPNGAHAIACGLDAEIEVEIEGHAGYYCAGMNKLATVRVHGNVGTGAAENMMSGPVIVEGSASQSAGATGRGGLLVIHGDASARCGISMKGIDIVVRGSVGHMSAFMAQTAGSSSAATPETRSATRSTRRISTFAARWPGSGPTASRRRCTSTTSPSCTELLKRAGFDDLDPAEFRRYGSARQLYNFKVDNAAAY